MKYIGVKIVDATPMTSAEFNKYKDRTARPEDVTGDGYLVTYPPEGYQAWGPKDVFDKANRPCDAMPFGHAVEALKQGKRVCRKGWNGKGMFVYLVKGTNISKENLRNECKEHVGPLVLDGASVDLCSHIDMKAVDGSIVVGWLASQTDMLSDDWMILD